MSGKGRQITNIRIYIIQFSIFLFGGILAIMGLYMVNIDGLATAGFILLSLGAVFVVLSYIYARFGARVIGTNCPFCYGKGHTGKSRNEPKEICPVCDGSGKLYSQSQKHLMEIKRQKEIAKENASNNIESVKEEHT